MNKTFNEDAISIMDRMIAKNYKVDLLITDPHIKLQQEVVVVIVVECSKRKKLITVKFLKLMI
jgi:DNA modification methylase